MNDQLKAKAAQIKLLVLDVDGTLTDGGIYLMPDGTELKRFNTKDGLGIKRLVKSGVRVRFLSHSAAADLLKARATMLGVDEVYGGSEVKSVVLQHWQDELQLELHQIAFMGDDVNDLELATITGLSACPSDAVEEIQAASDIIIPRQGGHGAVRYFIDKYLLSTQ